MNTCKNKEMNTETDFFQCYHTSINSRVLLIFDLFQQPLCETDISETLEKKADKGVRGAIKKLLKAGIIKKTKTNSRRIRKNRQSGKLEFGLSDGYGKRYLLNGNNALEIFFNKIKQGQDNPFFEKLEKELLNRYNAYLLNYGFTSNSTLPNGSIEHLENLFKKLPATEEAKNHSDKIKIAYLGLEKQKEKQQEEMLQLLIHKKFDYFSWISMFLQKILVEEFILTYSRLNRKFSNEEINKITETIYDLEPQRKSFGIENELYSRIQNFPNLLAVLKMHKETIQKIKEATENKKGEFNIPNFDLKKALVAGATPPEKCRKCGASNFKEIENGWKCLSCGKISGKKLIGIFGTTQTENTISKYRGSIRPDLRTRKTITKTKDKKSGKTIKVDSDTMKDYKLIQHSSKKVNKRY